MSLFNAVESNCERKVGLTANEIRSLTPEQFREYLEKKLGKKMKFVSEFPTIGRGNVLRDGLVSNVSLNADIDAMLAGGDK